MDIGVSLEEPQELVDNAAQVQLFGGEYRKAVREVKTHLVTETTNGAGAGAEPTASAVVADIVDVVRTLTADRDNRVPHLAFQPTELSDAPILPVEQTSSAYYLRMDAQEKPGVLAKVTNILGEQGINIEAITQKETREDHVPVIILTQTVVEQKVDDAIAQIEALEEINGTVTRIRVEHFNS